MESAHHAADRAADDGGRDRPWRRRAFAAIAMACSLALTAPVAVQAAVQAAPEPTTKELRKKLSGLNNKIEILAENYNGQRIKLTKAQKTAKRAQRDAKRRQHDFDVAQGKVRRLAATSYMTGGIDPTMSLAGGKNPRVVINQTTMLHHIAAQDGAQVKGLAAAHRKATKANKTAQKRVTSVKKIYRSMGKKKHKIQGLISKTSNKVFDRVLSNGEGVNKVQPSDIPGHTKGDQALRKALSQQGKPYVWGAAGPSSFDCSGLTMWAYKQVGVSVPHYTVSQYNASHKVTDPRPGDLVFFYSDMHHMGMYIGNGMMVQAPHTGDVVRVSKIGNRPVSGYARPY